MTIFLAWLDYLAGPEISFSLLYLLPISLVAWFADTPSGAMISVASALTRVVAETLLGTISWHSAALYWNAALRLGFFLTVSFVLATLKKRNQRMEARVAERTAALMAEIAERKRLEREVLDTSSCEQQRIAQELHDGLCQHLAGVAFMCKVLEEKLDIQSLPEAEDSRSITDLINQALIQTRNLARGLFPVELDADGLVSGLEQLASSAQKMHGVTCYFECEQPVEIREKIVATHLYRIAQEGINNAIKHGRAKHILINLAMVDERVILTVEDDGLGLPEQPGERNGIGLRIMKNRAGAICASLNISCEADGWTVLTCSVPGADLSQGPPERVHDQTRAVHA